MKFYSLHKNKNDSLFFFILDFNSKKIRQCIPHQIQIYRIGIKNVRKWMIEELPNLEEWMENKNDRMIAYDYPIMTDDVS